MRVGVDTYLIAKGIQERHIIFTPLGVDWIIRVLRIGIAVIDAEVFSNYFLRLDMINFSDDFLVFLVLTPIAFLPQGVIG